MLLGSAACHFAPGHHADPRNVSGRLACQECEPGQYESAGSCLHCPTAAWAPPASSSIDACVCNAMPGANASCHMRQVDRSCAGVCSLSDSLSLFLSLTRVCQCLSSLTVVAGHTRLALIQVAAGVQCCLVVARSAGHASCRCRGDSDRRTLGEFKCTYVRMYVVVREIRGEVCNEECSLQCVALHTSRSHTSFLRIPSQRT